ncbi:MAG: hypothetical protein AB1477_08135 [Acidobacteriota bacterium]
MFADKVQLFDASDGDVNNISPFDGEQLPDFAFEAYGVRIHLSADNDELLEIGIRTAKKALVGRLKEIECSGRDADHRFSVHRDSNRGYYFRDEGEPTTPTPDETDFCRLLNTMIRIQVAAKAKRYVFIHSGVVAVNGRAIVLPGDSYAGKTRLVAELIRRGAVYFSDEYAVLDEYGKVHPFERNLSMRPDGGHIPYEVEPEDLGAVRGKIPVPAGMLVLTKFEPGSIWKPEQISLGQAILEMVPKAIGVRNNPAFYLTVLNRTFKSATILKSLRSEAAETAERILEAFYKLPVSKDSGCIF